MRNAAKENLGVTSLNDLNLTLRQRIGSKDTGARFGRTCHGEVIQFYVRQNFKLPKKYWQRLDQRGKIIEFESASIRKSA